VSPSAADHPTDHPADRSRAATGGWIGATPRRGWSVADGVVRLSRASTPLRPAQVVELPAQPQPIAVDLGSTALVVVDVQNDFCHPDGWLASIGVDVSPARAIIDPLRRAVPALRRLGVPVVWLDWATRPDRANLPAGVLHVYDPDGRGVGVGSTRPTGHPVLQAGSWGAAVVDELAPEPTDVAVGKHRMSGFWDTELDSVLRQLDVTTLLLAGVNADQCVLATLIDAACLGYDVILLEDCSATTSPAYCWDATIYNVRQCFGFTATAADLVAAAT
jgi:ureidoacrylate peracid hydrolase